MIYVSIPLIYRRLCSYRNLQLFWDISATVDNRTWMLLFRRAFSTTRRSQDSLGNFSLDAESERTQSIFTGLLDRNASVPTLPVELWLHIISFLEETNDLYNLSRTSSILQALALPSFRTLKLTHNPHQASIEPSLADFRVIKSFQDHQRATIVTCLHIMLPCFEVCEHTPAGGSLCNKLDYALGKALNAMINLEVLDINCKLCLGEGRHRYFAKLTTQRLRDLSFSCRCNSAPSINMKRGRNAPISNTIEALNWSTSRTPTLDDPTQFPKLNAMVYHGGEMEAKLLSTRPIQRLYVRTIVPVPLDSRFQPAFNGSPGIFTHIIHSRLLALKTFIGMGHRRIVDIQHIGTLPAFHSHDIVRRSDSISIYNSQTKNSV